MRRMNSAKNDMVKWLVLRQNAQ